MTHGAAGRVGTRGVNGNAPSAGAAPHCRVEPRVPQPLTPWGRVPRAARPSGTKPGSVPVSPGRGNAAPRLCRRLGLRSSPRTPPAPPKHPSPSRLCRRSPGRCHPAVFRTALSQPVPNCLSALRCGRRSARHGGLCGHTAVRRAASGLAGSTAGSAVGHPRGRGWGGSGAVAEQRRSYRTARPAAARSHASQQGLHGRFRAERLLVPSTAVTQSYPQTCAHVLAHTCAPLTRVRAVPSPLRPRRARLCQPRTGAAPAPGRGARPGAAPSCVRGSAPYACGVPSAGPARSAPAPRALVGCRQGTAARTAVPPHGPARTAPR